MGEQGGYHGSPNSGWFPLIHGVESGWEGKTIRAKPTVYIKPSDPKFPDIFKEYASRLQVPYVINFRATHVIAVYSDVPVLSDIFYPFILDISDERRKEAAEKVLALWLNTTWGIMALITSIWNKNKLKYVGGDPVVVLEFEDWDQVRIFNVKLLDDEALERIASVFDEVADLELKRLPEQYSSDLNKADPARLRIDIGFLRALRPGTSVEDAKRELAEAYPVMTSFLSSLLSSERAGGGQN